MFEEKCIPEPMSGCWIWVGEMGGKYGRYQRQRAHRVSYELYKGQIPEGLVIDHLCRNKICVNPDHLEAVSSRTNTIRGLGPSAINAKKTHCKHGHLLSPDNVKTRVRLGTVRRVCKECLRRQDREAKARKWRRLKTSKAALESPHVTE